MSIEKKKQIAKQAGRKAYEEGKIRAISSFNGYMGLIEGLAPGEGSARIAESWLEGWDQANLAGNPVAHREG